MAPEVRPKQGIFIFLIYSGACKCLQYATSLKLELLYQSTCPSCTEEFFKNYLLINAYGSSKHDVQLEPSRSNFYLCRRRRKQVQECSHSVRSSVRPSVPKSCHHNSSETTDPFIMKLGMQIGHHMMLCISAGNFDPLIFVGVMPLGTQKILIKVLVITTPLKLLIRFS